MDAHGKWPRNVLSSDFFDVSDVLHLTTHQDFIRPRPSALRVRGREERLGLGSTHARTYLNSCWNPKLIDLRKRVPVVANGCTFTNDELEVVVHERNVGMVIRQEVDHVPEVTLVEPVPTVRIIRATTGGSSDQPHESEGAGDRHRPRRTLEAIALVRSELKVGLHCDLPLRSLACGVPIESRPARGAARATGSVPSRRVLQQACWRNSRPRCRWRSCAEGSRRGSSRLSCPRRRRRRRLRRRAT